MSTVQEVAARAASDLLAVLAAPHSDEFRKNALAGAKVDVARALVDAELDPSLTPYQRRKFHASPAGYEARMAAFRGLPSEYGELLTVLDRMAAGEPQPVAA